MARGPYAKGVAKREEILTTALEVVSERGFGGASVKELADAVGLTPAGLLHYFGSKNELFLQVLRKRDELDAARFLPDVSGDPAELAAAWVTLIRHNAQVPGLWRCSTGWPQPPTTRPDRPTTTSPPAAFSCGTT